jgi:hypothetical protein
MNMENDVIVSVLNRCKEYNQHHPLHIVCKGGAHLSYVFPELSTTDIDLTVYRRSFEPIRKSDIQELCVFLVGPGYDLTGDQRLYTITKPGVSIDIVVVDQEYLRTEQNEGSFVYSACRALGLTMKTFYRSLFDHNKLFPNMAFELEQSIAGMKFYQHITTRNFPGDLPNMAKYKRKLKSYTDKAEYIKEMIELDMYDHSDELSGGRKSRRTKKKRRLQKSKNKK